MQTTTMPATGTILALDLGKFKSIACGYGAAAAVTCRAELRRLFVRYRPAVMVIEACGLDEPLACSGRWRCDLRDGDPHAEP